MTHAGRLGNQRGAARITAMLLAAALTSATVVHGQSSTIQRIRYGEVVSAEKTIIQDRASGRGASTGATVGAIAGYAIADRGDRWIGSLLGGAVGGAAGHAAERAAKKRPGWQLIIKLDGAEEVGVQVPAKKKGKKGGEEYRPGDRVRLMTGPDGRTQVSRVEG